MTKTWRRPLDEPLRDAYLARLGWRSPPPPTLESLRALHRAQIECIPYEVVWLALGETRTIEPLDSVRHIAAGRGGYCYHLNGALGILLDWLGFDVHWRVGGVQGTSEQEPASAVGNHLVLEVHGLPTEESPGGRWFVDSGLGDGLHEPAPLVEAVFAQGPFTFALRPSATSPRGWRFDHDAAGSFFGMDFAVGDAAVADFEDRHHTLTTSPDSGFVRVVTLARRDAGAVEILRGLVLKRLDATGRHTVDLTTRADYFAALADIFRLPLSDVDTDRRAGLWARLQSDHERHLADQ
ncbi:arylamine N-acetyltransferase family protein [Actinokineospora sp.]|uniref:arylamine N-acetyltransferase family protein n=1 Tax=Actinokineospora sp. TaxID=1872133 RepID=UPI0040382B32